MTSVRVLKLVVAAVVLLLAWYAGRDGAPMGVAVAIVGFGVAYLRPVLGIPAAVAMAAAALYVPGVALAVGGVALVLALLSLFVNVLFDWGGVPPSDGLSGSDATTTFGWPGDGGGWF